MNSVEDSEVSDQPFPTNDGAEKAAAPTSENLTRETNSRAIPNREDLEREMWDTLTASLLALGRASAELCPPIGIGVQDTILRLRRRLAFHPNLKTLHDVRQTMEIVMRDFGRHAKQHLDRRLIESNELLVISKQSADLLEARDRAYIQQMRLFSDRAATAAKRSDPAAMRESMENLRESLLLCLDSFSEDSRIAISDLRENLHQFEKRRQLAEETTVMDPGTGLFRREEVERRVRRAYYAQAQFCVMKFVVHDFSDLQREHGPEAMEVLMKHFAERLLEYARPQDPVARWSQNSVMILAVGCPLDVATDRAYQMAGATSGEYRMTIKDHPALAEVQVTAIASEPEANEYLDDFLTRADLLSPVAV